MARSRKEADSKNGPQLNNVEALPFPAKAEHPLFEEDDLKLLSIIQPHLSQKGQKIITFFINLGDLNPTGNDALSKLMNSGDKSALAEMLPNILGKGDPNAPVPNLQSLLPMLLKTVSNPDGKSSSLNPKISQLLSMLSNK